MQIFCIKTKSAWKKSTEVVLTIPFDDFFLLFQNMESVMLKMVQNDLSRDSVKVTVC